MCSSNYFFFGVGFLGAGILVDIEGDDLADLRASKDEAVSTELPTATIPSNVKMKLSIALDKIKDAKLNNNQKLQLVAQVVDSLGVDKSQLGMMANKIRSKMESKKKNGNIA